MAVNTSVEEPAPYEGRIPEIEFKVHVVSSKSTILGQ